VESKAREMSDLVSNVLDLVRLESGHVALRRDWQTLDDLVGSALAACAERLAGHRVELRLAPDLPPVWVDATLIVQVLTNLLDNVAKYTPAGTRVTISAAPEPDRTFVRVTVDDEGMKARWSASDSVSPSVRPSCAPMAVRSRPSAARVAARASPSRCRRLKAPHDSGDASHPHHRG